MTGYFAQVENGVVLQIRKVTSERIAQYPELYSGVWVEISDMSQYPAVGYTYSSIGGFRPPKPYPSWSWDEVKRSWNPPTPYPQDDLSYSWDEVNETWEPVL